MVDFKPSDEQCQYQQLARDFVQREIVPRAVEYDRSGEFPEQLYKQLWQLGLMNVNIPEAHGGLGLGVFDACLIAEEIGAGCTGIGAALTSNELAISAVLVAGNEEQRKEFLEPLTAQCSFAACLESGSQVMGKQTGGDYLLDSGTVYATNAGLGKWYFLLASVAGQSDAFLVPADTGGITVGQKLSYLGQKARCRRAVVFNQVRVPERYRLAQPGHGAQVMSRTLNRAWPLISAAAVGLARSAMEHSIRYSRERITFGQPIANHQAVSYMIADMAKDIQAARLMTWQAAWLFDHGADNSKEAAMAKTFAADVAMRVAIDAVQIFGGYGYSKEYPVEKLMRDAKMLQVYNGTAHEQRLIIGQNLIGVR